ncbi:DUF4129 domain-containing protein [Pedococcus sp. KACC 23699]|uniref:DUF4129 domain-containing protein n=1 Tax=Pedococcus sp. KACC 23699 TaxID=3149228 RepID=A0AAU7JU71_9MICO
MTGRGWGLLGGGALTLLLAAWVSATGPVAVFARQDLTSSRAKARGIDYRVDAGTSEGQKLSDGLPGPAQPVLVAFVTAAAKVLLAIIVLALLVVVARELRRWWRSREAATAAVADADMVPEVMRRAARESEELLATGTPANAVVAAWVALESAARSLGVRDDPTRTSTELVTDVLRSYSVDRGPLDALAALYREARFSRHPVGEDMRTRAREALQQVQVELQRATPKGRRPGAPATVSTSGRTS